MTAETHLNGSQEQLIAGHLSGKWDFFAGAAEPSQINSTFSRGGVMLQARKFLCAKPPKGSCRQGSLWRSTAAPSPWWTATYVRVRKAWVLFATGYFLTGVDGPEYVQCLQAIEHMTEGFKTPHVLIADCNSTTHQVAAAGVPEKCTGFIASTGLKTSTVREIDFALMSTWLAEAYYGITQLIGPYKTHVGVRLVFRRDDSLLQWVLKQPKALPQVTEEAQHSEWGKHLWKNQHFVDH